jgi:hypothetical protein
MKIVIILTNYVVNLIVPHIYYPMSARDMSDLQIVHLMGIAFKLRVYLHYAQTLVVPGCSTIINFIRNKPLLVRRPRRNLSNRS